MAVLLDLPASLGARHLQPGVGFGPSFSHSRLDASAPMADPALGGPSVISMEPCPPSRGIRKPMPPTHGSHLPGLHPAGPKPLRRCSHAAPAYPGIGRQVEPLAG